MVFITVALLRQKWARHFVQEGFRDSIKILVAGGKGGNGYPKLNGVGGQGGNVKVVAKDNVTLSDIYKTATKYAGQNGRHSTQNLVLGLQGEDVTLQVPVGVTITTELGKKLGELNEAGQELVVAKGGAGGNPKNGFLGTKGQELPVVLDLKLIADVGLVGFPNAGKSTILKAISRAKPKIASYAFTTFRPNIGTIVYKDLRQISVVDLPGLIESVHVKKGRANSCLRHIERSKINVFVIDVQGFQFGTQGPHHSCIENILLLNKEMELYNKDLVAKPSIIVINKMDTPDAKIKYDEAIEQIKNLKEIISDFPESMRPEVLIKPSGIMGISAKRNREDVEKLKEKLRRLIDVHSELQKVEIEANNAELYSNIRQRMTEKGPRLV